MEFISMLVKSLALVAAMSSAYAASHVAADLVRALPRLTSRALPAYVVAPPLALYSQALTRRWMSTTPIKAPDLPKPLIYDLEKPLTPSTSAPTLAPPPKKLLELPDELYTDESGIFNTSRILDYVKKRGIEREFEELVLNNCTRDIEYIAHIHGNDRPLLYCVKQIHSLSKTILSSHPYRLVWEEMDDIEGTLINRLKKLGYITVEGELVSKTKEISNQKLVRAFENIISFIQKKREEIK
jgi:hypothetical protein